MIKNMHKKVFALTLLFMLLFNTVASYAQPISRSYTVNDVTYTITVLNENSKQKVVNVSDSQGGNFVTKYDKISNLAEVYDGNKTLKKSIEGIMKLNADPTDTLQLITETNFNKKLDLKSDTMSRSFQVTDRYSSDYYDVSYVYKNALNEQIQYDLDFSVGKNRSISTKWFSYDESKKYGTNEYSIKSKASYFKNQLKTADDFSGRIEGAWKSNMPGDVGFMYTWVPIMDTCVELYEDYNTPQMLGLILSLLEAIPYVSLGTAFIETLSLGPVIASNLYNCYTVTNQVIALNNSL